jgi:hypothetical protein
MARRLAEGKTRKETIRCLKTYVAREVPRAILTDLGRAEIPLTGPLQVAA